jgi:hypothetical protein
MEIMEEDKQCICCGKVKDVLISVIRTEERGGIFIRYRGICQECILKEDIEKVTKDFEIKKCQEEITKAKESSIFWEEKLNELKEKSNGSL